MKDNNEEVNKHTRDVDNQRRPLRESKVNHIKKRAVKVAPSSEK